MKPKLLVNFHGFEMFQKAPNVKVKLEHYLLRPFVKKICKGADFVYSFGGKITDILEALNIDKSKILNQSNGIEQKWIKSSTQVQPIPHFIFLGRNERRKGIIELTEALKSIKASGKLNFKFTFIGPIEPNPDLNSPEIQYLGEIKDQHKIQSLLETGDVLVCPSHSEGMPTVILEAMANGMAILTTDVGASSKMIRKNGIILNSSSSHEIESSILKLANLETNALLDMKADSLDFVKHNFVWEKIAKDLLSDLNSILLN